MWKELSTSQFFNKNLETSHLMERMSRGTGFARPAIPELLITPMTILPITITRQAEIVCHAIRMQAASWQVVVHVIHAMVPRRLPEPI
jgi:hypothetical protein